MIMTKELSLLMLLLVLAISTCAQDEVTYVTTGDYAKGLYNKKSFNRLEAARQLALIGEKSLPELEKALMSGQENPMWASIEALTRIGSNAVPVLIRGVQSDNVRIKEISCTALQRIGTEASASLPILYQQLKSDNASIINAVLRALPSVESNNTQLVEAIQRLATNSNASIAGGASNILQYIGMKNRKPNQVPEGTDKRLADPQH